MACMNKCGNTEVADEYECSTCLVKGRRAVWCVITKVSKLTLYDFSESFNRTEAKEYVFKSCNYLEGYREARKTLLKVDRNEYLLFQKSPTFNVGELMLVDPIFGREIVGAGRKPSKWDVVYEEFSMYDIDKAVKRALEARNTAAKEERQRCKK